MSPRAAEAIVSASMTVGVRVPAAFLTASGSACSSPALSTAGCDEMMRSTNVVPVRGMPMMKIGASAGGAVDDATCGIFASIASNTAASRA